MNAIRISEETCIGCGLCEKDCPNGHLYLKNGKAHTNMDGCIECGHCFAICPVRAVQMEGYDCTDLPVVPVTALDSETLLAAMKSRRTIRQFTEQTVEPEKVRKILEAGQYSPTAANAQNIAYTILGSRQKEAEALCVNLFRRVKKLGTPFVDLLKRIEITDDYFFKGAPLVIVVSARSSVDAGLASTYMELMAESLGLGVLYSGFFVACTRFSRKLKTMLALPKGHTAITCMVIGYPDVKYQRIAPRKKLRVKTL